MSKFRLFVLGMVCVAALPGCISLSPLGFGSNRGKVRLEEIEPAKHFYTTDEVLIIPLSGLVRIGETGGFFSEPGMLVTLKDRLKAARDNDWIKAVVLRIDSPGGTVTAADLIHEEIMRFKKETSKPVIAQLTGVAASGGLYIAMAADEIYAVPTTVTGSIGVITMLPSLKGLGDKIGFEMRVMKSGANKDLGSPWAPLTEEQRDIFQALIDDYFARFKRIIMDSRGAKGLTRPALDSLADGRVFTPEVAVQAHLIDGIKYPEDILARAREAAKIKDASIVSYEYPYHYRGNIYAQG
ncbi:MAG: signal peptide peptidase SppA, partial [bacterium]|nr:signal peptide peptidase SppA [bacterium]